MSLSDRVFAQTLGDFFRPIRPLLEDESVNDVLVNSWDEVYVDRDGRLVRTEACFSSEYDLLAALTNLAQSVGKSVGPRDPMLEAKLPDGSRVQALLPPVAPAGPCVAIHCARSGGFTLESFAERGPDERGLCGLLRDLTKRRSNTIVCGDAASGKTALLEALVSEISADERVIILERSSELKARGSHVVRVRACASEGNQTVETSFAELVRAALRMRPDRLVVGEVREPESRELIRAMSSRCAGCLTTLDVPSSDEALRAIGAMAMACEPSSSRETIARRIASALDVVVQVVRLADGRRRIARLSEVRESTGDPPYELKDLYRSKTW